MGQTPQIVLLPFINTSNGPTFFICDFLFYLVLYDNGLLIIFVFCLNFVVGLYKKCFRFAHLRISVITETISYDLISIDSLLASRLSTPFAGLSFCLLLWSREVLLEVATVCARFSATDLQLGVSHRLINSTSIY